MTTIVCCAIKMVRVTEMFVNKTNFPSGLPEAPCLAKFACLHLFHLCRSACQVGGICRVRAAHHIAEVTVSWLTVSVLASLVFYSTSSLVTPSETPNRGMFMPSSSHTCLSNSATMLLSLDIHSRWMFFRLVNLRSIWCSRRKVGRSSRILLRSM